MSYRYTEPVSTDVGPGALILATDGDVLLEIEKLTLSDTKSQNTKNFRNVVKM